MTHTSRPKLPMKGFPIKGAMRATGEFIAASMQAKEYKGITAEDLKQLIESGHPVTVIDCRDVASFGVGHITGAINIHYREFMERWREVPNGAPVITACYFGLYSRAAARQVVARSILKMITASMAQTRITRASVANQ